MSLSALLVLICFRYIDLLPAIVLSQPVQSAPNHYWILGSIIELFGYCKGGTS